MLKYLVYLEYLAGFCILAGALLALLVVFALKVKPRVSMAIKPVPARLALDVRRLLEEVRFEMTIPDGYKELTHTPLPPQIDRLNLIATHLRKYVELKVFDYIRTCSYVSRSIWLRKPRVITETSGDLLTITVYGIGNVIIHSIRFRPSDYAHESEYFKNKVY